jgi:molybdopterin/thiamine biosynthesis adenylyltransferase
MYDMEAQLTTIVPGQTPCLACLVPAQPPEWRREFPVFGAVAGTIACLAVVEVIKVIAALGQPLLGKLLAIDMREMNFHKVQIERNPQCAVCGKR